MRVEFTKQGLIQTNDGKEDITVLVHGEMIYTRDVYYVSGATARDGELNDIQKMRIYAGRGLSISSGTNPSRYTIELDAGLATDTTAMVWKDKPSGSLNGINCTFSLMYEPTPAESIMLCRNGLVLSLNDDFILSGSTLTFLDGNAPSSGSMMWARYQRTV